MKVAYYAPVDFRAETGVVKKIISQATTWRAMNVDVKIYAYTSSTQIWENVPDDMLEFCPRGSLLTRLARVSWLVDRILEWKPDLVYMRQGFYYPPFERLMSRIPTILEINTNDVKEASMYLNTFKRNYYMATRNRLLRKAAALVCVTHEIARAFTWLQVPIKVVSNGIDLSTYHPLKAPINPVPRLVFMGHKWDGKAMLSYQYHGIDKILYLAKNFPTWFFDIVGYQHNNNLIMQNVRFTGHLERSEYEKILACADLALGPLGLHIKSMNEACPLKVREYLAYGIPTIIGYKDTDFPDETPFLLRLPNTPDNVDSNLNKIENFVLNWRGKRVPRYAIEHLDAKVKEEQRIAFMKEILTGIARQFK